MDFHTHVQRQMAFFRSTFGPGTRREGLVAHIYKELDELGNNPDLDDPAKEWADIIILATEGLARELESQAVPWDSISREVGYAIQDKQSINEQREWPDWRKFGQHEAIEHDHSKE